MNGTYDINNNPIPAKLIIGDKEFDVTVVSCSIKDEDIKEGIGCWTKIVGKRRTEVFTCIREYCK